MLNPRIKYRNLPGEKPHQNLSQDYQYRTYSITSKPDCSAVRYTRELQGPFTVKHFVSLVTLWDWRHPPSRRGFRNISLSMSLASHNKCIYTTRTCPTPMRARKNSRSITKRICKDHGVSRSTFTQVANESGCIFIVHKRLMLAVKDPEHVAWRNCNKLNLLNDNLILSVIYWKL
jgi:hypothetical protein